MFIWCWDYVFVCSCCCFPFLLVGVEGLEPSVPEGAGVTDRDGYLFRITPKTKKATEVSLGGLLSRLLL